MSYQQNIKTPSIYFVYISCEKLSTTIILQLCAVCLYKNARRWEEGGYLDNSTFSLILYTQIEIIEIPKTTI